MTPPWRTSLVPKDTGVDQSVHLPGSRPAPENGYQYAGLFVFMIAGSVLTAYFFELGRYGSILAVRELHLGDRALLFWLLAAKTMAILLPVVVLSACLIGLGLYRLSTFVLITTWIMLMFWLVADLMIVGFTGNHFLHYIPYVRDALGAPDTRLWQWAGEDVLYQAGFVLVGIAGAGVTLLFLSRRLVRAFFRLFPRMNSRVCMIASGAVVVMAVVGVVPALAFFSDRSALRRVYRILPANAGAVEAGVDHTERVRDLLLGNDPQTRGFQPFAAAGDGRGAAPGTQLDILNGTEMSLNLRQYQIRDDAGHYARLEGNLEPGTAGTVVLPANMILGKQVTLIDRRGGRTMHPVAHSQPGVPQLVLSLPPETRGGMTLAAEEADDRLARRLLKDALNPAGVDPNAYVEGADLPNVLLVVFESFRHSAVREFDLKRLNAWADQGLRLERHYSGSNCSHLGLFSLFYGRCAMTFDRTLDLGIEPQMLYTMRRSGYELSYVTAGEIKGFRRVDEYLSPKFIDHVYLDGNSTLTSSEDRPESDRRKLAYAKKLLTGASRPQFVLLYLMSTHYSYAFPPEFDIFQSKGSKLSFMSPRHGLVDKAYGRYRNSLLFLEHEFVNMVETLDPKRNVVIVTSDHGESTGEDGMLSHGSRMSEIQTRVPFFAVGRGFAPQSISTATSHADVLRTLLHGLADRPVHIRHSHGRDLLAGELQDETTLTWPRWPERDGLMIVRGEKKMLYVPNPGTSDSEASISLFALVDEVGEYE